MATTSLTTLARPTTPIQRATLNVIRAFDEVDESYTGDDHDFAVEVLASLVARRVADSYEVRRAA